jgi:hypothetical protein
VVVDFSETLISAEMILAQVTVRFPGLEVLRLVACQPLITAPEAVVTPPAQA